ncbi:hypothetical protein TNCV_3692851 [Trichonephila clavipes]|nr:hypothetical protein TNCV_3692851 [Trichonephila clavipes]
MIHDRDQTHFCSPVREWLDMTHPGYWNERTGGSVLWPSQSPYLTPLYFVTSQGTGAERSSQWNLVARLHAACTRVDN